jgi:hypothetical protein
MYISTRRDSDCVRVVKNFKFPIVPMFVILYMYEALAKHVWMVPTNDCLYFEALINVYFKMLECSNVGVASTGKLCEICPIGWRLLKGSGMKPWFRLCNGLSPHVV